MEHKLPLGIVTRSDLLKIEGELLRVGEAYRQAELAHRKLEAAFSPIVEQLFGDRHLQITRQADRDQLTRELAALKKKAPIVHVSIASEPSAVFLSKLLRWFRDSVHPHVLLQISVRPSIAAGMIVRTTNRVFDFSMRQHLDQHKDMLLAAVRKQYGSR